MWKTQNEEILDKTYLKVECREIKNAYKEKILLGNRIPGLLTTDKRNVDDLSCYYYDVTFMRSLSDIPQKERITVKRANRIFESLFALCRELEAYLLEASDLSLNPQYIFEEPGDFRFFFLYLPDYGEGVKDMRAMTEFLIARAEEDAEERIDSLYLFYNEQLLYGDRLTVAGYIKLWEKFFGQKEDPVKTPACLMDGGISYLAEEEHEKNQGTESTQPGRNGRIYSVPYHGMKLH